MKPTTESKRPIIRRATREDIETFSSLEINPTTIAWCAEVDGEIAALAGFARIRGRWRAFADLPDDFRKHKVLIVRTSFRLLEEARKLGIRFIYAEADPNEPNAVNWMNRLGFELDPRSHKLYRWKNGELPPAEAGGF